MWRLCQVRWRAISVEPNLAKVLISSLFALIDPLTKLLEGCIKVSVDIKQLRQRLGMSRDAFARELGVTYKTVYLWEKGKTKPSPMAQQKLEELEKKENG